MTYLDEIKILLGANGDRKGMSLQAIKKAMETEKGPEHYKNHLVKSALKHGVEKEELVQNKGHYKLFKAHKKPAGEKKTKTTETGSVTSSTQPKHKTTKPKATKPKVKKPRTKATPKTASKKTKAPTKKATATKKNAKKSPAKAKKTHAPAETHA